MRRSPLLVVQVASLAIVAAFAHDASARPTLPGEATFGAGDILVHFATSGPDAPPLADADSNGTPDFVDEVATTADQALRDLMALGFRRPLSDGTAGGDGRIDLYLANLQAADGNTSSQDCANNVCSGYAIVENDYAGYTYTTRTEGIRSVVPHELFHLIQYAYAMDQSATWTEGSAVWAVEHLYRDGNSDFERQLPGFLSKTFRPFERPAGGFGDSYAYGAALWPVFLEQRFGVDAVREAWEQSASADFIDATDAMLVARGSSFADAWTEFTQWNAFTGAFFVDNGSTNTDGQYPGAMMMPAAPREPLASDATAPMPVYVEGYSARYVPLQLSDEQQLTITPDDIDVAAWIVPNHAPRADGQAADVDPTGDSGALQTILAPGEYTLVLTGLSPNTITTRVDLAFATPTDGDGGGCSSSNADVGLVVGLLLLSTLRMRRRRPITLALFMTLAAGSAAADDKTASTTKQLTDDELANQSAAAAEGEVIVVTGTKSETPRAASPVTTEVIDRQRIEESGAQTLTDALTLRPGIWVDRGVSGDQGVSLQGLSPQYTLILVDGQRQIGRTDGVMDLDRFGLEDIERIEIVRGPSSVLYGSDALGGVINLVTRTPKDGVAADGLLRIDSRLGREARARLAGGSGAWAGSLVGSYRNADPIRIDDDGTRVATSIDGFDEEHATGHVVYRESATTRVDANADYVQRDLRGVDASATGAVFDRRNLVESASAGTAATYSGEKAALRVETDGSYYRDQFLSNQRMSTAEDQFQITYENLVEARATGAYQLGRHRAMVGIEGLREALESPRLMDDDYHDRYRTAVFAQDEWKLLRDYSLLIVPAARLDADSQFGTNATPSLAARYEIGEGAVVRASVGMGYRAPSFKELLLRFENPGVGYVVEGNPDLAPEKSKSVQVGAEYAVTQWFWVGADLYYNRLRDMIGNVTLPDDGSGMLRFGYDNFGLARTMGGEINTQLTRGALGLELGYALNLTKNCSDGFHDDSTCESADGPIEGMPKHRFTATVRWRARADGMQAFIGAVATGGRPYYLDASGVPTYTETRVEVRARINKRFSNGLGGFIGVDNLLDAGDDNLDRLQPRTFYTGAEVHL
ncbi:MAG TPA: TonB-dependent receptor [Kofleriaceae bacterium]|jgi:outer membrane receptor for ferrienterochelin and colicins